MDVDGPSISATSVSLFSDVSMYPSAIAVDFQAPCCFMVMKSAPLLAKLDALDLQEAVPGVELWIFKL